MEKRIDYYQDFELEKYRGKQSRYICPNCHRPQQFSRYKHKETGSYLADFVGICNRREKCGYHYPPATYFQDNPERRNDFDSFHIDPLTNELKPVAIETTFIPKDIFRNSLTGYAETNFFIHLKKASPFSLDRIRKVAEMYHVGSTDDKRVIFWQVDENNKVRTGKIMEYQKDEFKRTGNFQWVHSYYSPFNLVQVPFGTDLLNIEETRLKPIGVVEGEKTAIVASIFLPNRIWLSVGSRQNIKQLERIKDLLEGRTISLFPDKGDAFSEWKSKAQEMNLTFEMDYTVQNSNMENGSDLADYLLIK